MSSSQRFLIALVCIAAAFVLIWFNKEGIAFLTLIGGSPLAGSNEKKEGVPVQAAAPPEGTPNG